MQSTKHKVIWAMQLCKQRVIVIRDAARTRHGLESMLNDFTKFKFKFKFNNMYRTSNVPARWCTIVASCIGK